MKYFNNKETNYHTKYKSDNIQRYLHLFCFCTQKSLETKANKEHACQNINSWKDKYCKWSMDNVLTGLPAIIVMPYHFNNIRDNI